MKHIKKLIFFIFSGIIVLTNPIIIPHRGGTAEAPENTIFALERSSKLDLNILEIDVQVTKDKQVVLYHGRTLEDFTDGTGFISDYNLKDIKKLDAAYKFKKMKNIHIETMVLPFLLSEKPLTNFLKQHLLSTRNPFLLTIW